MSAVRTSIVRSAPVAAARRAGGRAAAPALRRRIWAGDHADRIRWVRWLIPGSLQQMMPEILGFGELAAAREPRVVCEIGTLQGGTSMFLATLSPSVRAFVGIDLSIHNGPLIASLARPQTRVTFIEGSSRAESTRERLREAVDGEPIDLLFIDGDHSYDGVRSDFLEFRPLVRPGGLIGFHDIVPGWGAGDVPRFWPEIRDSFRHWEFVADRSSQQGFGIGVIEHDPGVVIA